MKKKVVVIEFSLRTSHLNIKEKRKRSCRLRLSLGKRKRRRRRSNQIPVSNYRHVWQIVHEFHWTREVYNYYHQVKYNSDQYHLMSQELVVVHPDMLYSVTEQLEKEKKNTFKKKEVEIIE